jgi:Spy/CpxP family protein refolding chaperone
MRVLSIVMTLVITAFVSLGSAFAGPRGPWHEGGGGGGFHGGRGLLWVLEKLTLNEDQEREIASILGRHRDEIGRTMAGMVEARTGLREAVTADVYSEGAVRQAAKRAGEQEEQAAVLGARILNEMRPVLTAEQKDQVKNFAGKRAGKMKGFVDARLADLDEWIKDHTR